MTLAATPKIELHLHLEGAAPPAFIRGLAAEKREDISGIFDERGGYAIRDFWHFLKVYEAATSVIRSPEDYRRLTLAVLEESAASGVIYCETFISPDFCGGRDLVAWRDYLAAIEDAAALARAITSHRDAPSALKAYESERMARTARIQREARRNGIIYHLSGPPRFARDLVLRRQGPALLERYGWIYGA